MSETLASKVKFLCQSRESASVNTTVFVAGNQQRSSGNTVPVEVQAQAHNTKEAGRTVWNHFTVCKDHSYSYRHYKKKLAKSKRRTLPRHVRSKTILSMWRKAGDVSHT